MTTQNVLQSVQHTGHGGSPETLPRRSLSAPSAIDAVGLHFPDARVACAEPASADDDHQFEYPYGIWHPLYDPPSWAKAPTATKLLYLGMAVEEGFEQPQAVTITPSSQFAQAMKQSSLSPKAYVTKQFHNNGLGAVRRVGVVEYGRKRKRTSFERGDEDRIHFHLWIDSSEIDDAILRKSLTRCFMYGKSDMPSHRYHLPYLSSMTYKHSVAAHPFNLAETGGPGWLLYGALRNKQTRRFLNIPIQTESEFHRKFGRRFDFAYTRSERASLDFPEIVFFDSESSRIARSIFDDVKSGKRDLSRRFFSLDDLNNHNMGIRPYEEIDYILERRH